jgi:hypothetical protein
VCLSTSGTKSFVRLPEAVWEETELADFEAHFEQCGECHSEYKALFILVTRECHKPRAPSSRNWRR